jgi:hypothetical protein
VAETTKINESMVVRKAFVEPITTFKLDKLQENALKKVLSSVRVTGTYWQSAKRRLLVFVSNFLIIKKLKYKFCRCFKVIKDDYD